MTSASNLRMRGAIPAIVLATLLGVLPASPAGAESLAFQVAFADVPGTEYLASGRIAAGIRILEARRENPQVELLFDERSTLCAAYVLHGNLVKAASICQEAVANDNSVAAYNNRGVYRAHAGDIEGAMADFARIRVDDAEFNTFVEELKSSNARLMATTNHQLVSRLRKLGKQQVVGNSRRGGVRGADIEDIGR